MALFHKKERKQKQKIREAFGKPKTEDFDWNAIGRYSDRNPEKGFQKLSEKTFHDLNLNDLFLYIDRTTSKIGQQFLYNNLWRIPADHSRIEIDEKWIARFEKEEPLRTEVQYILQKLSGNDAYYLCDLFQSSSIKPPRWLTAAYFLSFTNALALILMFFTPSWFFLSLIITIVNGVLHYLNKKNIYVYLYSMPQLFYLNHVVEKLIRIDFLQKEEGLSDASVRFLRQTAKRLNFFRLDELLRGDPFGILWGISELIKIFFILEPIFLFRVLRGIKDREKDLQEAFAFVGRVDQTISVASLRAGLPYYCRPEIIADIKAISFTNITLPLVKDCVSNTLQVDGRSILITGSNMSGKTTFIRTVGINTVMGLTLNTCFAHTFALPRLKIYSAILLNDDLMNDKSFYLEEVQTIGEMIDISGEKIPHLFLLDEIYKGTNTIERVSGGKAVLSWLNRGNNLVFISTHDIELTELLHKEYALYHFSEQVDERNISFDYKIKPGKMKTRNAIKILELNAYPAALIAEARRLAEEMDKKRVRFDV